ncbi:MAG: DUF2312 domain-containing protein [Alphaproteobacteria bacterium]
MADVGGITGAHLRSYIERIERLEEEKKALADDIRDVFAEAKGNGFDVKVMRQVLKLRKLEPADRQEQEMLLETYLAALGMAEHIGGGDDGADDGE